MRIKKKEKLIFKDAHMKKLLFIKIFIHIGLAASITPNQIDIIFQIFSTNNYSQNDLAKILNKYNVNAITDLSEEEANSIISSLSPNNISTNDSTKAQFKNPNIINDFFEKRKHTYSNIKPRKSRYSQSVGMSESLGEYGGFNFKININNNIFAIGGTSLFIGGAGIGFKYPFNQSRISPFITSSVFTTYTIPLLCENCDELIYNNFATTAMGLDILTIQTQKKEYHIQIGILAYIYSKSINRKKSPNDKPEPLPFMNIKVSIL